MKEHKYWIRVCEYIRRGGIEKKRGERQHIIYIS
jgi:hypothetical protein